jgi:hypothetical protein
VRTETLHLESEQRAGVIASDGAGYYVGYAGNFGDVLPGTLRAAGGEGGYLVAWKAREPGAGPWLLAAVANHDGSLRNIPFFLTTDASAGVPSLAGIGSNFIAAYRTARGIETRVVDSLRVAVVARHIVAEVSADPIVVRARAGAALYFSLSLNGWNDDSATYRVALNDRGEALGEPELIARGKLLAATSNGDEEIIAIRDGEVTLLRGGEEIARLPQRFHDVESIAAAGGGVLVAAVAEGTELLFVDGDGEPPRGIPFGFVAVDVVPHAHAVAGGTSLVLWSEQRAAGTSATYYARFKDGLLDSTPRRVFSRDTTAIASDGSSTFLAAEYARNDGSAMAGLLPAGGPLAAHLRLGEGRPSAAIWDGQNYVVFFVQEDRTVLRVARVSRDGLVLTPPGGLILATGSGIGNAFVTPTASGFVIAYGVSGLTRIAAFSRELAPIRTWDVPAGFPVSIAGNGSDRAAVGLYAGSIWKTQLMTDRLEPLQLTSGASLAMAWSNGVILACSLGAAGPFVALWQAGEPRAALLDPPRVDLEAPSPIQPPSEQTYPLFASSGDGSLSGVYARRVRLADFSQHLRMYTRTFTVLPKGASSP